MVPGFMKRTTLLICLFAAISASFAQNKRMIDSLTKALNESRHDTVSTKTLNSIAKQYWTSDPDTSMVLLERSIAIANQLPDKKYLVNALLYKAYTFSTLSEFDSSIATYKTGIALADKNRLLKAKGQMFTGAGNVYMTLGDYEKAIPYFMQALQIQEAEGDKNGLSKTYNSLGVLFNWEGDHRKALSYHFKGLKLKEEIRDSNAIGMSLNNLGNVYDDLGKMDSSLFYHYKSLEVRKKINDLNGMGLSYNNIANTLSKTGRTREALENYSKALELFEAREDDLNQGRTLFNIGNCYFIMQEFAKGYPFILKAEKIADAFGIKELQKDVYAELMNYHANAGDYKIAYEYAGRFKSMNDSIYNESKTKEIQSLNTKYETEKKEQENKALQLENALSLKTLKQQKTVTFFTIVGLLLVSGLAFFIFRGLRQQRKANRTISAQKAEVEHQKELVEEKNKEITDSITYARRIQTALLPSTETFSEILPNSFVLFKPKDIVSGDFFWITQKEGFIFYVAADCTGHGVPGAFMSMLGTSFLNEIINEKGILEPCDILDLLKIKIIKSLKQKGEVGGSKDGMDMVLCRLNPETKELVFAAANNPLWLLRNGEIKEYKPDKQPVGIGSEGFEHFSQHTIQLQKEDAVYIFSDGFADQFGGPKGKKFKYRQLEEVLIASAGKTLNEQKASLDKHFEEWRGMLEQVDDVCVIGVRF
jgi:serine phosphatase RsbU (regulator of sigma subunit)